jgi:hypothetical protein
MTKQKSGWPKNSAKFFTGGLETHFTYDIFINKKKNKGNTFCFQDVILS